MTIELTTSDLRAESIRDLRDAEVQLPGDPGYDAARLPWSAALDQRPAAVAQPRTVAQVQQVVRAAAAADLRIAPQSTGHNAGPLVAQGLDDVVVLRTSATVRGVATAAGRWSSATFHGNRAASYAASPGRWTPSGQAPRRDAARCSERVVVMLMVRAPWSAVTV